MAREVVKAVEGLQLNEGQERLLTAVWQLGHRRDGRVGSLARVNKRRTENDSAHATDARSIGRRGDEVGA